jgi:hypothetical protein
MSNTFPHTNRYIPHPNYISGPISLSEHYSSKYDKHIYIFGEKHEVVEQPCLEWGIPDEEVIPIHLFIEKLVNISNDTIDVFIETEKLLKDEEHVDTSSNDLILGSDLHNIREYYKPYLTIHKTNDPFGFKKSNKVLARFHYTDVRHLYSTKYENIFIELSNTIEELNRQVEFFSDITTANILYQIMTIGNISEILELGDDVWKRELDEFEEISGLKKQINKISDRRTRLFFENILEQERPPFIEFTKNMLSKIIEIISEMLVEIPIDAPIVNSSRIQVLFMLTKRLVSVFLISQMDVYLLARIFKNPEFKNIIIYVGNYHAIRYREWLDKLGFELLRETSSETKCVEITRFKPFFNI